MELDSDDEDCLLAMEHLECRELVPYKKKSNDSDSNTDSDDRSTCSEGYSDEVSSEGYSDHGDTYNGFEERNSYSRSKDISTMAEKIYENDPFDVPPAEHLEFLKTNFGYSSFRQTQWKIIKSIIEEKRDSFVIMATGYGKSLCFQYPAVYTNGITIVISPLISLMEDQVHALQLVNIPACLMGTAQPNKKIDEDIISGQYRIVYMSPEYVIKSEGLKLIEKLGTMVTLIAIDEAHCISQWGHDFRQTYKRLGVIRNHLPKIPILAVTATATGIICQDVCTTLGLRQPMILSTGFDRPNLELNVREKGGSIWQDLRQFVSKDINGSIIIYCLTRKETQEIAEVLTNHHVKCAYYHAGMDLQIRSDVHKDFIQDKLNIIVATIAFGMGIDKPDVRLVIHYGSSQNMESYYQEIGRAGRDGLHSKCVLFHCREDFELHQILWKQYSTMYIQVLTKLSAEMRRFLNATTCRREYILKYFGGNNAETCEPRIDCCDNCYRQFTNSTRKISDHYVDVNDHGQYDFTEHSSLLLRAINLFNGYSGLTKPISVLRGSKAEAVAKYSNHPLNGMGKSQPEQYWKLLSDLLVERKYLEKQSVNGSYKYSVVTIRLTQTGKRWLEYKHPKLMFTVPQEMYKFMQKKKVKPLYDITPMRTEYLAIKDEPTTSSTKQYSTSTNQSILHPQLLLVRSNLATKYDAMPYTIASNIALQQMATTLPLNIDEMKQSNLDGFSHEKIMKFGPMFIECIKKFMNLQTPSSSATLSKFEYKPSSTVIKAEPDSEPSDYEIKNENRLEQNINVDSLQRINNGSKDGCELIDNKENTENNSKVNGNEQIEDDMWGDDDLLLANAEENSDVSQYLLDTDDAYLRDIPMESFNFNTENTAKPNIPVNNSSEKEQKKMKVITKRIQYTCDVNTTDDKPDPVITKKRVTPNWMAQSNFPQQKKAIGNIPTLPSVSKKRKNIF